MNLLILPSILTIILILLDNYKGKAYKYILFFFFILFLSYALNCTANEYDREMKRSCILKYYECDHKFTNQEKEWIKGKAESYYADFIEEMHKIDQISLLMPLDLDHRQLMQDAIKTTVAASFAKTIQGKGLVVLIAVITEYMTTAWKHWQDLWFHLDRAETNLDSYEFYMELIRKNNELYPDIKINY